MPYAEVKPVVNLAVRGLCVRPYPLHPRGCPNFDKKVGCPPQAPRLGDFFDLAKPTFAVWNAFPLGEHVKRMRAKHPGWTERQLRCCLYWQPRARAALEEEVSVFMCHTSTARFVARCPEAMGLDVTATMLAVGVKLEWPPAEIAYQVALAGTAINEKGE